VKTRSFLAYPVPITLLLLTATPAAAQDRAAATIRALVAAARHPWARRPDFSPSMGIVERLYPPSQGVALWVDAGGATPAARAAIGQLLAAPEEGLDPRDYDAAVLDSVAGRLPALSPEDRARFDLLLTVDLVRFLDDVRRGRLRDHPLAGEPSRPTRIWSRWSPQRWRVTRFRAWCARSSRSSPSTATSARHCPVTGYSRRTPRSGEWRRDSSSGRACDTIPWRG